VTSPRRQGAVVVAVALAARLAVVAWAGTRFPAAHDGVRYDALAARLAAGLGYTWAWPDGTVTTVAHYPVGYPAVLALAYRVFGHSVVVAGVENACVGALAALATYGLGLAVASPRVALGSGLAVALHPGLVLYTPGIMTEGLTAALIAAAAWVAVAAGGRGTPRRSALLGALVGLAGLVRPQTLLLAPLFGLLAAGRRGAAVSVMVAALVCAPWVARNCGAVGRCTLTTNSGWNLLIGAQPGATGAWQAATVSEACKDVFGEATTDACFGHEAAAAIASAPWRWAALAPKKLAATFDYGGIGGYYLHLSNAGAFPWGAVLGAGAIETVFERAATALCLLGCARIDGPRRRARVSLAILGAVFCVLPAGWVAVVALCCALACLGRDALGRRPLHAATLFVLGSTAAVHAVFFGAPRYALLAAPLVTTLAVVSLARWRASRNVAAA
jgi:hypothetical protein